VDKVLVIMEENRTVADVSANMPFLMSQSATFGSASDYYAIRHPSLPNYLAIAGGSTFGVTDDRGPAAHQLAGPSVFGSLLAAGRRAKTYAEAMPDSCQLRNHGRYAVRHNPWTYFADPAERASCTQFDVAAGSPTSGALADDVSAGTLPNLGLVVPDLCHDGHDCSASVTDAWLQSWLPVMEAGPDFRAARLAIVVTWDEDDRKTANRVPMIVIHPSLKHTQVAERLDHYALSGSILRMAGLEPLREAGQAPDLFAAFGLR